MPNFYGLLSFLFININKSNSLTEKTTILIEILISNFFLFTFTKSSSAWPISLQNKEIKIFVCYIFVLLSIKKNNFSFILKKRTKFQTIKYFHILMND